MVADALVQWYSRIGMPLIHVSDHRSHFKDKVIKELNGILQINHHMTTVYSPWANGTVETVNNDIQKLLRSLLSEWQMESSEGATCTSFNSVCFESFAFFVSSKLCPSQDHDRPGRVQPAISSIRSWCKQHLEFPSVRGKIEGIHERLEEISGMKCAGKLKLRWKALGLPRQGMLTTSAQLWNLTKEITSWLLLMNLKISPKFSSDGIVLMKSLKLSEIVSQPMSSEALNTFKKSLFHLLFLPCTVTRANDELKLMHRDAALIVDKELPLALWTLSSSVATLSGTIGHVVAQVSFQNNFIIGTEPRVDEPANQTHWGLVGWLQDPMFFFRKAIMLDQIQIARFVSWIHGRPLMKSFHDGGHRSLLKLCRDLCLTQGTRSVLPVLEHVVDTYSMVSVSTT